MGFGPVGSIRKQVMKQMREKDKAFNNLMKNCSAGYYKPTTTRNSTSLFKTPKSKIKF